MAKGCSLRRFPVIGHFAGQPHVKKKGYFLFFIFSEFRAKLTKLVEDL